MSDATTPTARAGSVVSDATTPTARAGSLRPRDVFLSIMVLFNFAVAHPLLDVIGREPLFFSAHGFSRWDIVLFALGLTIVLPALAASVVLAVRRVDHRAGAILHAVTAAALAGVFVLHVAGRIAPSVIPALLITLAVIAGAATALALHRTKGARSFMLVCSPAPALVLALFVLASPTNQLLFPASAVASGARIERPAPIVFMIFDEVPVTLLMAPDGTIDAEMYPNFAALAADGTWFRNATTVFNYTNHGVPAILTGRYPDETARLPVAGNYPQNLFSLLASTYEIRAIETGSLLCRKDVCEQTDQDGAGGHWRSFLRDMRVVSQHVLLPPRMTRSLPSLDDALGHFEDHTDEEHDERDGERDEFLAQRERNREDGPVALWERFVEGIEPTDRPTMFFHHTLLTHVMGKFLHTGHRYPQPRRQPGRERQGLRWTEDEWLALQGEQRHILQLMYADTLLGDVLQRLRDADLYDDSLIVVTSDHGTSFQPGRGLRYITPETTTDVTGIPLLFKRPGERSGVIDDRRVETIDILPSIAEVIGMELPEPVDGYSFLQEGELRSVSVVWHWNRDTRVRARTEYSTSIEPLFELLRSRYERFEPGGDAVYRVTPGNHGSLLGAPARAQLSSSMTAAVDDLEAYDDVRPRSAHLPAFITGGLEGAGSSQRILAIGLNGRIVAVTRSYIQDDEMLFSAIIPPDAFVRGANSVQVLLVEGDGPPFRLTQLEVRPN